MPTWIKYTIGFCCFILFSSCAAKHEPGVGSRMSPPAIDKISLSTSRPLTAQKLSPSREIIVNLALSAIGTPYRWGGHDPSTGFDCSGLVQYTHRKASIHVPRTSSAQISRGRQVNIDSLVPADLVFFKNPGPTKSLHVGIYIGKNQFVHAPGRGRTVTKSSFSNPYFQSNFIAGRSLIR